MVLGFLKKDTPAHTPARDQLAIVVVGHVDHGKSTVIGRLLHDTDSLPEGKMQELTDAAKRRGCAFEWSFLLDSFQAERDQAITIDTTQIRFKTPQRDFVIIDAPGHREFLKNMVSGAAQADAAVLVVDAEEGVREQTRRHAYLLSILGISQVTVVLNKMDKVGYGSQRFSDVAKEIKAYLKEIGVTPSHIIPICARDGDMMTGRGNDMPWYSGKTLLESLESYDPVSKPTARALRFPVQDVYRFDEQRIIVGRVETGIIRKGDKILFSPGNETATVTSLETWPPGPEKLEARAGDVIGITLDQPIFVERGHIASPPDRAPMLSNVFRASIFWLSGKPLKVGDSVRIRYGTTECAVSVQAIDYTLNTDTLEKTTGASALERNIMAGVTFRGRDLMAIDPHSDNTKMGRIVIYDNGGVTGGGLISMDGYANQRRAVPKSTDIFQVDHLVNLETRFARNGHKGAVIWLTGLSGAGKSTLAMLVERALFDNGYYSTVLDGDNVRHGLNADLGFSPEDRAENIRRVGEVAALMAESGLVCITSFISPYQSDRARARAASRLTSFHEIYIRADLATCEERDPKGLYKKARAGILKLFTGIDSPYEAPDNPELVIDTQAHDIPTCVAQILDYVEEITRIPNSPINRAANDAGLARTADR